MPCPPEVLRDIPLFSNMDDDELKVLAAQVELKNFPARQRIFRAGSPAEQAYVVISGAVRVTVIDEDQQEVVLQEPLPGEFFGFASMLEQTPHMADAVALEDSTCIEIDRNDLMTLFHQKPHAIMDVMAFLGRQLHNAHQLARARSLRPPEDVIEERETFGERIADHVASFGGSWTFIIVFIVVMAGYSAINVVLGMKAWDPYPFILLNLFLSALAAIQAPVIMMSQNRQDKKDRIRSEMDFYVNRHARTELQGVALKLNNVGDRIADIEELLRQKVN
jgi:CRP/FNR family transcriptional regulator, cyclic AMP receptor protein